MKSRGWSEAAWPHDLAGKEGSIEGRVVGSFHGEVAACVDQLGEQHRQGFPGIALPQAGRGAVSIARQSFSGLGMGVGKACRFVLGGVREQGRQRREAGFEVRDELERNGLLMLANC